MTVQKYLNILCYSHAITLGERPGIFYQWFSADQASLWTP